MELSKDKLYLIKHKKTGLYSTGHFPPRYNKVGKVWTKGTLNGHLTYVQKELVRPSRYGASSYYTWKTIGYEDCEVVELSESNRGDLVSEIFIRAI